MLTNNDELLMLSLMSERSDFKYIIEKLKEEQQYTVSQISHEIRNPVTLINSSLQLIEKQHPEVSQFAFWTQTKDDMIYLRRLLDELSNFNNGERLHLKNISIQTFLASFAASMEAYLHNTNIQFSCEIAENLPSIMADETKLHQVVSNLIRNAVESIDDWGEVKLRIFNQNNQLLIQVEDNGCGIDPEHLDTLFLPFVTHKKCGSGLGLAIAKRVIDAHQGTLTVTSEHGKGTSFTISLPCS